MFLFSFLPFLFKKFQQNNEFHVFFYVSRTFVMHAAVNVSLSEDVQSCRASKTLHELIKKIGYFLLLNVYCGNLLDVRSSRSSRTRERFSQCSNAYISMDETVSQRSKPSTCTGLMGKLQSLLIDFRVKPQLYLS